MTEIRRALSIMLSLTLLVAACDDEDVTAPAEPPTADETTSGGEPETPSSPERVDHFATGPCTMGEQQPLEHVRGRASVGVSYDSVRGGLLVRTRDDERVDAWRLSAAGQLLGAPLRAEIPAARDVRHLHRIGSRYLLSTHAPCPPPRASEMCLHLRGLQEDGRPSGPAETVVTRERIGRDFHRRHGDGLLVLRSYDSLPPTLDRYTFSVDGSVVRTEVTDLHHDDDGQPAGIGLAVDGARWASLVAYYGDTTALHLHSSEHPSGVPLALQKSPITAELDFVEGGLRIVMSTEGAENEIAMVSLDGATRLPPREIAPNEALPHDRARAVVSQNPLDGELSFARYDVALRPIATPVTMPSSGFAATDGDGSAYVLAESGGTTREPPYRPRPGFVVRITCRDR